MSAHQRRLRARTKRRRAVLALAILALALLGFVGWGVYTYLGVSNKLAAPDQKTRREVAAVLDAPAPVSPEATSQPDYILLLGDDARPGETRARSDTIIVVRADVASQSVTMLSIPRDSRVSIQGHGLDKIAHANAFGGPALAIRTVKDFTGLPINHYVKIKFAGVSEVVDAMGGIVMDVDASIPDFSIKKGVQRLNGEKALAFVRSRAFAGSDFARIKHQQQFLKALAKQALQPKRLTRLPAIIDSAANHIETDMSVPQIVTLASDLRGVDTEAIGTCMVPGRGTRINMVYYYTPDATGTANLIAMFRSGQVSAK
jgi:LCP family protein required for cell wall assembly